MSQDLEMRKFVPVNLDRQRLCNTRSASVGGGCEKVGQGWMFKMPTGEQ